MRRESFRAGFAATGGVGGGVVVRAAGAAVRERPAGSLRPELL